jgi:hypothetical protein
MIAGTAMNSEALECAIFRDDGVGEPTTETISVDELCRRAEAYISEWVGKRNDTGLMMYDLIACIKRLVADRTEQHKAAQDWQALADSYREDCLAMVRKLCPPKDGIGYLLKLGAALGGAGRDSTVKSESEVVMNSKVPVCVERWCALPEDQRRTVLAQLSGPHPQVLIESTRAVLADCLEWLTTAGYAQNRTEPSC